MKKKHTLLLAISLGSFLSFFVRSGKAEILSAGNVTATADDTTFVVPEIDLSQLNRIPRFENAIYQRRLDSLERKISLDYNNYVQAYINLYAYRKRQQVERMLGLSEYYFPMIEKVFIEQNIPTEFKYLAIVESALNPYAVSRVGATGMWQFMFTTGKMYGLRITSHIDERKDPYKATVAASKYFKDMYARYGDWLLVIAAYNCGPGNVNKAIRRAGGAKNFWAIRPYLPEETRGYVPAYIAATYIMNCAEDHNLYPSYPNFTFENDTVELRKPVSFRDIEAQCGITVEELRMLNPMFKRDFVPAYGEQFSILVPATKKMVLGKAKDSLYRAFPSDLQNETMFVLNADPEARTKYTTKVHVVKRGETLGRIAARHSVSVADLKKWNKLRKSTLLAGQKLKIRKEVPAALYAQQKPKTTESAPVRSAAVQNEEMELVRVNVTKKHVVKRGENLSLIAGRHKVTVADLKEWNNLKSSALLAGQSLKIRTTEEKLVAKAKPAPVRPEDAAVQAGAKVQPVRNEAFVLYKVEAGDTLYSIAKRYEGMTVEKLLELNGMDPSSVLKTGMVLKVPSKG